ncbi:MAG: agmatine deiminase family protein [Sulfurospirillaceae bacterium]|nr:agmatine deiminase family protein [Sulfurospirillaceae bacterium]MDD3463480.1 agmatine deiminase family protein [Sulfurospirillaceae bacterium]
MKKRLPAEWEEQEALLVVFPSARSDWAHSIDEIQTTYIDFIGKISRFQPCFVVCENKNALSNMLPSLQNITLIEMPTNDTWIRDFGGINIFKGKKIVTYDFIFNAWGNKFDSSIDNTITKKLFQEKYLKGKLKSINFILEGGSIDCNGDGVMLSTSKCLFEENRNSKMSKKKIRKTLKKLFALKRLHILKHGALKGDDTDSHIDTLARFIDKETIVYVKCYDKEDEHFEELEKMEKELKKLPYTTIALPLPSAKYFKDHRIPATYMNFVFVNNAILVPIYSDEKDAEVLAFFEKQFPQREIVPVESSVLIREHGSLHCASMNIYKSTKGIANL